MGWFSRWIAGSKEGQKPAEAKARANPFAIPIPDDADPALFRRIPTPKRRGLTREQFDEACRNYIRQRLEQSRGLAEFDRNRAAKAGCTEFIWQTARDSNVCEACAPLSGKRFTYRSPPAIGLPGVHLCSEEEVCRCWAEPVIPD